MSTDYIRKPNCCKLLFIEVKLYVFMIAAARLARDVACVRAAPCSRRSTAFAAAPACPGHVRHVHDAVVSCGRGLVQSSREASWLAC